MFKTTFTGVACILLFCATLEAFAFSVPSQRILNGTDVRVGEIPFIVSIRANRRHICGGALLDEQFILTAAHCLDQTNINEVTVTAGTIYTIDLFEGIKVKAWIYHEDFDRNSPNGSPGDIGVIRLAQKLVFSETLMPVRLPPRGWEKVKDQALIVAGWGSEQAGGPTMQTLKKTTLYTMSDNECRLYYGTNKINSLAHICAENMPHYAECHGDSGGPLFIKETSTIVGVVSWSWKPCGRYPGVFTKVDNYLDWIANAKLSLSTVN